VNVTEGQRPVDADYYGAKNSYHKVGMALAIRYKPAFT